MQLDVCPAMCGRLRGGLTNRGHPPSVATGEFPASVRYERASRDLRRREVRLPC
jgi:hypothetical protein